MKIAFVIGNLSTHGSRFLVRDLVFYFKRKNWQVDLVVSKVGGTVYKEVEDTIDHVATIPPRPASWSIFAFVNWIVQSLRRIKPLSPVVHSFNYSSDFWEALIFKMSGRKYIFTKTNMQWKSKYFLKSILADRIIALNRDQVNIFFTSRKLRKKTTLIFNGVDLEYYKPRRKNKQDMNLNIAVVANLIPLKGHPFLIDVASNLSRRSVRNVRFLLAGSGDSDFVRGLRDRIEEEGLDNMFQFMGFVDDIPALLSSCDIAALPTNSIGEACSMSVLESMSCGLPVIVNNVAGNRDLVNENHGWVLDVNDVDQWSDLISELANDIYRLDSKAENARKFVQSSFSREEMMDKHRVLYSIIQ